MNTGMLRVSVFTHPTLAPTARIVARAVRTLGLHQSCLLDLARAQTERPVAVMYAETDQFGLRMIEYNNEEISTHFRSVAKFAEECHGHARSGVRALNEVLRGNSEKHAVRGFSINIITNTSTAPDGRMRSVVRAKIVRVR